MSGADRPERVVKTEDNDLSFPGEYVEQEESAESDVVNQALIKDNVKQEVDDTPAPDVEKNGPDLTKKEDQEDQEDDDDNVPLSQLAGKTESKRQGSSTKKAGRPPKRKSKSDTPPPPAKRPKKASRKKRTPQERKEHLERCRQMVRVEFEQDKKEILDEIPYPMKSKFGSIAFSKWGSNYQPILILSPYQVPPGPVREQWMKMFQNLKRTNRLHNLSYLVYWYGSTDLNTCYSFLPKNQVVLWEDAAKKKLQDLPDKIQTKINSGKPLTKPEQELFNAYSEMKEDHDKAPSDRKRGVLDFPETYDLLEEADADEYDSDLSDDEDANLDDDGEGKSLDADKKEINRVEDLEEAEELPSKSSNEVPERKTKKKMVPAPANESKAKKKKASLAPEKNTVDARTDDKERPETGGDDKEDIEEKFDRPMAKSGERQGKKKSKKSGSSIDPQPMDDLEKVDASVANNKVSDLAAGEVGGIESIGDKDDQELDEIEDSDDEKDDDYVEKDEKRAEDDAEVGQKETDATRSPRAKKRPREKPTVSQTKDSKVEKAAKKQRTTKSKKEGKLGSDKSEKYDEHKLYDRNWKEYRSALDDWKRGIEEKDTNAVLRCMGALIKGVPGFSVFFMEHIGKSDYFKGTKSLSGVSAESLINSLKEMRQKMKEAYDAKKAQLPPGFKLKVSHPLYKIDEESLESAPPVKVDSSPPRVKDKPSVSHVPRKVSKDGASSPKPEVKSAKAASQSSSKEFRNLLAKAQGSQVTPSEPVGINAQISHSVDLKGVDGDSRKVESMNAKSTSEDSRPPWFKGNTLVDLPSDPFRKFGLDLLRFTGESFAAKTVDVETMARAMESSIFKWAVGTEPRPLKEGKDAATDKYFNKIHSIVAAVAGKHQPGTLAKLISSGTFKDPAHIVELSEDVLFDSFEGRPMQFTVRK